MTVATFNQTDYTSQDSATYKANIDADISVLAKVADLFAPHQSNAANMTITLDAGRLQTPWGNRANCAAQASPVMTAPTGGNNRIDLVVINANGNVAIVTGTPAANPSPPSDYGGGNIAIAEVRLATGMNQILNGNITDVRALQLASNFFASYAYHDVSNTANQYVPCGFRPSAVLLIAGFGSSNAASIGYDDGINHYSLYMTAASAWIIQFSYSIMLQPSAANTARALIGSKNATGFNLTWSKVGTPTGDSNFIYMPFP